MRTAHFRSIRTTSSSSTSSSKTMYSPLLLNFPTSSTFYPEEAEEDVEMVKINVSEMGIERKTSNFQFGHRTRIFIMVLSLLCLTLSQMNSLTFNFTVICMDDIIQEHHQNNRTGIHWMESPTEKSLLFSGAAIGAMIGLIPSVPLISSLGIRSILTASGIVSAAGSFLFPIAVAYHYYAVLMCRILQGLGISILFTVVGVISGVWAPENETSTFLAILSCAFQLSSIISMPISGILCESSFGWRSIYYLFGILTFLAYLLFYVFYTDAPEIHRNVSEKELSKIKEGKLETIRESVPYKAICTDTTVIMAWLSVLGGNFGFFVLVLYGPSYLRDILHFDVKGTGFASAIPYFLSALVKFGAGQLSDRLNFVSEKIRFTFCAILSQAGVALGFLIMAFTTDKMIAQFAYTFAITASGLNIMGTIKCVQLRCRQHVHFAISVISFCAYCIQFFAPIGVGILVADNTAEEWSRFFLIVAVSVVILNAPFPFFTSAEPGKYVKTVKKPDQKA